MKVSLLYGLNALRALNWTTQIPRGAHPTHQRLQRRRPPVDRLTTSIMRLYWTVSEEVDRISGLITLPQPVKMEYQNAQTMTGMLAKVEPPSREC